MNEITCPCCNSSDVEYFSGEFETGVRFDMWRETQHEQGFQCQQCGLKFDASEEPNPQHTAERRKEEKRWTTKLKIKQFTAR